MLRFVTHMQRAQSTVRTIKQYAGYVNSTSYIRYGICVSGQNRAQHAVCISRPATCSAGIDFFASTKVCGGGKNA